MKLDNVPTLAEEASNLDVHGFPAYWYELTYGQIENMRREAEKNAWNCAEYPETRAASADETRRLWLFIAAQFPHDYGKRVRNNAYLIQRDKDHITGDYSASENIAKQDWRDFLPALNAQQVTA